MLAGYFAENAPSKLLYVMDLSELPPELSSRFSRQLPPGEPPRLTPICVCARWEMHLPGSQIKLWLRDVALDDECEDESTGESANGALNNEWHTKRYIIKLLS